MTAPGVQRHAVGDRIAWEWVDSIDGATNRTVGTVKFCRVIWYGDDDGVWRYWADCDDADCDCQSCHIVVDGMFIELPSVPGKVPVGAMF